MRSARLLLLLLLSAGALQAQTFDASQASQGTTTQSITSIDALWRFHAGDNPQWASPTFDDSSWSLLNTTSLWSHQGYRGYTGFGWYRLRLKLPATAQPLAINIGHINSAAEVYADGQLLGANGIMRPLPDWSEQSEANAFPLPPSLNGHSVLIAVRVWKSPVSSSYSGGGFHARPSIGSLALLQDNRRLAFDNSLARYFSMLNYDFLSLVLGCFSLGLFLLDRRSPEYAWFAVWAIGSALLDAWCVALILHQGSVTFVDGDSQLLEFPLYVAELLFLWGFLKIRRDWMLMLAILFNAFAAIGNSLGYHGLLSLPTGRAISGAFYAFVFLLVIARVLLSLKSGNRDARLLIIPICLIAVGSIIESIRQILFYAGWSSDRGELFLWSNGIVSINWNDLFSLLVLVSIAIAILLRFTRSAQEERRLSTELAAAREVQARLVPARLPALHGIHLEAAYLPATEVGGDFYQVFPLPSDSVLIVIGDVSGKGLKAAMTGTLALGALRALAQLDLPPSQILFRLNAQLTGSTPAGPTPNGSSSAGSPSAHSAEDAGFITCFCVHITPAGTATISNAGHLAPYCNGIEVQLDSGLPLGLVTDTAYAETTLQLAPGDTLTLLSDGVVEARNPNGALFGFDRTLAISSLPASQIAQAAQDFGQEDDITVLTLTRLATPTQSPTELSNPSLAPA